MRDFINLRYSLIPYIYTNARKAYDEGISLCRPLYYEYPQIEKAYQFKNEYFFGDDIIVYPVTKPIEKGDLFTMQKVWLPEGKWYEWSSGTIIEGGKVIARKFTIDEMPLYVKEGAIIPMQPKMKNTSEKKVDPLILNIFPGESGSTKVYDDEGNNQNFKNGRFTFTKIHFKKNQNKVELVIEPIEGNYPGMLKNRSYDIRFVQSFPAEQIIVNGRKIKQEFEPNKNSWRYDGKELSFKIITGEFSVNQKVVVEVILPNSDQKLLNDKIGKFRRLFSFTKFLAGKRAFWQQENWNDAIHPSGTVVRAAQTGYLISLNPKNAETELKTFEDKYAVILKMLNEVSSTNNIFKPYYDLLSETKE